MDEQKKYQLTGYNLVNLEELVLQVGEERAKEVLSDFSCPMNADVEYFLRHKAIEFSKQRLAQTHLVFTSYQEAVLSGQRLCGLWPARPGKGRARPPERELSRTAFEIH